MTAPREGDAVRVTAPVVRRQLAAQHYPVAHGYVGVVRDLIVKAGVPGGLVVDVELPGWGSLVVLPGDIEVADLTVRERALLEIVGWRPAAAVA